MNKASKRANINMILKTLVMLTLYTVPIGLLCFGLIDSPLIAVLLYVVSALGMGGIGMGVMHDANHGAYTNNRFMSYFLSHTLDFLGCSSAMWKMQHNVLHHTYTNIHGHDEDIDAPLYLFRFSPYDKRFKFHRYQHLYIWPFYAILTLWWITAKDFLKAKDYYKKGLIQTKREYRLHVLKLIPSKLFYFMYSLVLPMIMAPFSPLWILLGYILMHVIVGVVLSTVFQLAHVVPNLQFPQPDENEQMNSNWYLHQLETTSNFAPKNKLLYWYLGGLTNQIEHHLFPNICHVHYRNIGKIVERTAKEFNAPYHVNKSLFSAVAGHIRILRTLGRTENLSIN